jgi:DNA-binding NtrC family response regulator
MKRILIIDDEPDILEMLSFILEDEGYDVLTANSGNSALTLIKSGEFKPDLAISDIQMSDGDGVKFLKDSKLEFPQLKVILMTGFSNYNKEELVKLGALDIISKPFDLDEILKSLKNLL